MLGAPRWRVASSVCAAFFFRWEIEVFPLETLIGNYSFTMESTDDPQIFELVSNLWHAWISVVPTEWFTWTKARSKCPTNDEFRKKTTWATSTRNFLEPFQGWSKHAMCKHCNYVKMSRFLTQTSWVQMSCCNGLIVGSLIHHPVLCLMTKLFHVVTLYRILTPSGILMRLCNWRVFMGNNGGYIIWLNTLKHVQTRSEAELNHHHYLYQCL